MRCYRRIPNNSYSDHILRQRYFLRQIIQHEALLTSFKTEAKMEGSFFRLIQHSQNNLWNCKWMNKPRKIEDKIGKSVEKGMEMRLATPRGSEEGE